MCCECLKPEKPKVKAIGVVINPWPYQEHTFYGHVSDESEFYDHVSAESDRIKMPDYMRCKYV